MKKYINNAPLQRISQYQPAAPLVHLKFGQPLAQLQHLAQPVRQVYLPPSREEHLFVTNDISFFGGLESPNHK